MQPEQLARIVAGNVRRRRLELALTQMELAARTGIPQTNISDIEQGKRSPNLVTVAKLADGLSIPPSQLLSSESLAVI